MQLSKRLAAISQSIQGSVLADIGCDHAYVCIDVLQNHRADKAYACDVAAGPLESARANITESGLQDRIQTRLQYGLHSLPQDTDTLLISGMGGKLMIEILEELPEHPGIIRMILSPHKDAPALRRWLYEQGWSIEREQMVLDGQFYPVFTVVHEPGSLTLEQEMLGVNPMQDADYKAWLEKKLQQAQNLLNQVPPDKREALLVKISLLQKRLESY